MHIMTAFVGKLRNTTNRMEPGYVQGNKKELPESSNFKHSAVYQSLILESWDSPRVQNQINEQQAERIASSCNNGQGN